MGSLVWDTLIHDFLYIPDMTDVKVTIGILVSHATRYLCHQRLAFYIVIQPTFAASIGRVFFVALSESGFSLQVIVLLFLCSCLGATVVYGNILLRRRLRYLPPGLAKAKFIRLGYLKAMLTRGERICRCQDLPDKAFGDVSLAAYLIIVSHRWLHPYMCDICTDGYPSGVKLDRLVCR